jgi:hypothetical protein
VSPSSRQDPAAGEPSAGWGLLAAVLPAAERAELARRYGAEPQRWSLALGFVELYLGARLLLANGFAYFEAQSAALAGHLVDHVDPRQLASFDKRLAFTWSGSVMWLTWALRPLTWLLASIAVVGVARLVAFAVDHDAVGEPSVWLGLRVAQALRRAVTAGRSRQRQGPDRPDLLLHEPGCDLVVVSCRPKPEWNERITLAIGPRFFRLIGHEERPDRGFTGHAYRLREADPAAVFRGLVRYEPPGGG